MELFLWFWLLDRRFLCNMRPLLKHFSLLWIFPIISHLFMIILNSLCLFPFKNLNYPEKFISIITILEIISSICLFVMMTNLYNISKKQNEYRNVIIANSKDDNYWISRKNLLSKNGIAILILGIFHIIWSFYYLSHKNIFHNIFQLEEKFVIMYAYLNIFFCFPVIFLLACALIIKVTFLISAMLCTSFVLSMANTCCKKNRGLKKKIDFSEIQKLEPEFV